MTVDPATHWDDVYRSRLADQVSWYQSTPERSLRLIGESPASVIDVGGGASTLVDRLLEAGIGDVTVLDVSGAALSLARERLGERGSAVSWVVADLLCWRPDRRRDAWHDRAVLHFLSDQRDRAAYVRLAAAVVVPDGVLVVGGFAPDGPDQCSGLPAVRRSAAELAGEFAPYFTLEHTETEVHRTPAGVDQSFTWVRLRRTDQPAPHPVIA